MQTDLDVNPAFAKWRSSTGQEKEQSLNELVPLLERFATTICWKKLPDHKDSFPHIISNAVWRGITSAKHFRDDAKFSTWFYKITANECNRFLRDRLEKSEVTLEDEIPSRLPSIDARIDVIKILDSLEGPDHTLFRLVAEGNDFSTIARELKITRNATLVRWDRLKERLRDAL